MDEAQARIRIAGRNINNFRYADDTTLMAESEEELKSLLKKVNILSFNSYRSTKSSSWIGRVISSKLLYYPRKYRFNAISIKLPMTFFPQNENKKSQNLCGNTKYHA